MLNPPLMLIALLGAHFLLDYPLQGDFLSKAKNRFNPIPGVPWYQAMFAHAFMHGAAVSLITGIWWLGISECVVHFHTDDKKCMGKFTFNEDQMVHILFKILFWVLALFIIKYR